MRIEEFGQNENVPTNGTGVGLRAMFFFEDVGSHICRVCGGVLALEGEGTMASSRPQGAGFLVVLIDFEFVGEVVIFYACIYLESLVISKLNGQVCRKICPIFQ